MKIAEIEMFTFLDPKISEKKIVVDTWKGSQFTVM